MPTLFTTNPEPETKKDRDTTLRENSDNQLFISHITIYQSGVILVMYLVALELLFFVINLLIQLPLGFFITSFNEMALYSFNTLLYIGLIFVKIIFMLIIIFQWLRNYYEIRPGKIIYKSGLFNRDEKEFDCPDITKIDLEQGFWGRLFNFGTITLYVRNSSEVFALPNIPSPHRNLKLLQKSLASKKVQITMTNELIEDEK